MRPESASQRLFGITRSKGKMFELGLAESLHIAVPANAEPRELFVLTVATLGDAAAKLGRGDVPDSSRSESTAEELEFSASFFDAFLESRFSTNFPQDIALLGASAYYLAGRPGSSQVLARQLDTRAVNSPVDGLLLWVLLAKWEKYPAEAHRVFGSALGDIAKLVAFHYYDGSNLERIGSQLQALRERAYAAATPRDLLFVDIIAGVLRLRMAASAWATLPRFSGLPIEQWTSSIRRPDFPKELWPAQVLVGRAGLFAGSSGVIQMPTSAGKTRSIEIVIRSGFLSQRTMLAVVVTPFRALCHEVGAWLRHAFRDDDVGVNELSDAMQLDVIRQVAEMLGTDRPTKQCILVVTPEKLLYVLRQTPELVNDIGIVVYDEGHQFDSGSRGITYELLLTEIKALLRPEAQTVLVSAVIKNAQAIGDWLIGNDAKIVNGAGLLPTARSVAFASWIDRLGQLMFFESESYGQPDYFVPRVIEPQLLGRRRGERAERHFPTKDSPNDLALYFGIRLVPQGAVAVFCGRKDTATGIAARVVEIYERGYSIDHPGRFASADELARMKVLIDEHWGSNSIASRAATLGVFVHHGATPHGVRLSIEYAMQHSRVCFVVCTSTLAQGVNLPIRYLIVSSIHQGGERIKTRDFQNLIGRAGRSGMHTEGLVVFSDPAVYDQRRTESWKFRSAVELLTPSASEDTTSSLLEIVDELRSSDRKQVLRLAPSVLCRLILSDEADWEAWAANVVALNPASKFDAKALIAELRRRRYLISAVESYLMANRGSGPFDAFRLASAQLATDTLAYHVASDELKPAVLALFAAVADYVNEQEPQPAKQALYSRTLLGVSSAKAVERWVSERRENLLGLESNKDWLATIWGLFADQVPDHFFHTVTPLSLSLELASLWVQGMPYRLLHDRAVAVNGRKAWGRKTRELTTDDLVDFCDRTLGFECSLIVAAVAQFLYGERAAKDYAATSLSFFQLALKYGLPDRLAASAYEHGFADRIVSQALSNAVRSDGFAGDKFEDAMSAHGPILHTTLRRYPTYFESVLASHA